MYRGNLSFELKKNITGPYKNLISPPIHTHSSPYNKVM